MGIYDSYQRIAMRKRAAKTGELSINFDTYRELNIGAIVRRPEIPHFKICTANGLKDINYANSIHNLFTYLIGLGREL